MPVPPPAQTMETSVPAETELPLPPGVRLKGKIRPGYEAVLTKEALAFVADLHRRFEARRQALLAARRTRQERFDAGGLPGFLPETQDVRHGAWTVAPIPAPLQDRRVEITGPVDRKMVIGALNSGAKVFMADYEDSHSPTWDNCVQGQQNIRDAVRGTITFEHPQKGTYTLDDETALLVVRVRGWHLDEAHLEVDGAPVAAGLWDFGLDFFHNAKARIDAGEGPYYYLPKLEHHEEAKLWDDAFRHAQDALGIPVGTVKATVLIETLPAVFQMDEILWALREHIVGLNAGRWDYIFSCIKTLRNHPAKVLPDRAQVTMTVPHMRAYTGLLIATCHRRGAFAMGGMSAFIPDRRDPEVTERALAAVRADKEREAADGCDGTWVAHPDLIPVAMEVFDEALGDRPNQLHRRRGDAAEEQDGEGAKAPRPDESALAAALLDFDIPGGAVTEAGIRNNIDVALQYMAAWLQGRGAVAIHNLMEDAATAEISRSQLWQWHHNATPLADGGTVEAALIERIMREVQEALAADLPEDDADARTALDAAVHLLGAVALADDFPDFLTLPAYEQLTRIEPEGFAGVRATAAPEDAPGSRSTDPSGTDTTTRRPTA